MSRFRRNPAFDREIQAEAEFVAQKRRVVQETASAVREAAPVHTGYYRRRIRVEGDLVVAGDPFAHIVEAGSVNNPPYAPLRRGARAVGLRLDDPRAAQ